ncbi:hypothetical protein N9L68_04160, partial [bacterium]|nr:hypothetical protein [bacterium]
AVALALALDLALALALALAFARRITCSAPKGLHAYAVCLSCQAMPACTRRRVSALGSICPENCQCHFMARRSSGFQAFSLGSAQRLAGLFVHIRFISAATITDHQLESDRPIERPTSTQHSYST